MPKMTLSDFLEYGLEGASRLQRHLRSKLNVLPYMPQAAIVFHEGYTGIEKYIADHERARKILNYLLYEGCINASQIVSPKPATITQLGLVHDFSYLSQLTEPEVGERIFGQGVNSEALRVCVDQQRLMVGGTLRAARMAVSSIYPKRIINLGGGFHHAYPEGGYAFCVFNDVAASIAHLRKHGYDKKILIIDLDLHQGDGSKKFFAHDPTVITYSVHAESWDKEEFSGNYDIALGPGIGDTAYLSAIQTSLPKIIEREDPSLIFYLAGVDVAEDDELGDWRITHEGIFSRDSLIDRLVGRRRMVIVTAGGYGKNAWRHSARFFAYLTSGLTKPIASDNERLLNAMKYISRQLPVYDLTADKADEQDDFFELFVDAGKRTKLFDYYSLYGVECALEKVGIYEHLRRIGFPMPYMAFELDHPNGQAVRMWSSDSKKTLLMEAILDEKTCLDNRRILWIEWLLLQNPTKAPTAERPLLPGQTYPGLGCLTKVVGLLFMVADRLHFDGIGFNPAHYHVCFLAKGQGYFERPRDEARFRVAQAITAGMNIQQASQALANGMRCGGQTYKWVPARMVIPTSDEAKAWFARDAYQHEVEKYAAIELTKYGQSRTYRRKRMEK